MTDLEGFAHSAGRSARRVRDDDLACGRDPVWMSADAAWQEFSKAVIKEPTEELRALFCAGWHAQE